MSKTIDEQVSDDIHDSIVKAAQSILAYRDAQGLKEIPGTQHHVQLMLPEPNSHIRAQLTLTMESVPDFESTTR